MSEFLIYHITNEEVKDILAMLAKGLFSQGLKGIFIFDSHSLMTECDKRIWTFSSEQFIPHGMITDKFDKSLQSFYLTDRFEVCDGFCVNGFIFENDEIQKHLDQIIKNEYSEEIIKVIYMFSGILDSLEYLKIIQNHQVIKNFSGYKFFARKLGSWDRIF